MLLAAIAGLVLLILLFAALKLRGGSDRRGDLLAPPRANAAPVRRAAEPRADQGAGPSPIVDVPENVAAEARRLVAQDRKLEAIKQVRIATRWDLKRAKEWVERL